VIPLVDVIYCVPPLNPNSSRFELQVRQRDVTFGTVVVLELDAGTADMRKRWVTAVLAGMLDTRRDCVDAGANADGDLLPAVTERAMEMPGALREWMDWLRFPVRFLLKWTIPSMKGVSPRRNLLAVSFFMSMCWLGVFSYCVVEVCDIIADEFGISVTILGFTVAAIGTSFGNVVTCIAVSRQGKTGMAVANALGANIQNVFVALALPWAVQASITGAFTVADGDLFTASVAMAVTLGLLLLVVLLAGCKMPRWTGIVFLLMYAFYMVITVGQECSQACWPFCWVAK